MRASEERFKQLYANQKVLQEQLQKALDSFARRQAVIQNQLKDHQQTEVRTQELINRQNHVVNSFEARIRELQKLTSEQEQKIRSYQGTYNQVLKEIREG